MTEEDKAHADAVWQLVASKNAKIIEEIMEDEIMCEALERIMKLRMDEMYNTGFNTGFNNGFHDGFGDGEKQKGIRVFKNMINRGFSKSDAQAMAEISDELAERAMTEM